MDITEKQKLLEQIKKLYDLYHTGQIPTLSQHEVNPGLNKGSKENYIYFTIPPCLNFQRSSPAMWQAALKTYEDPETNYLFSPEEVVKQPREKIQRDLLKHKLSLQRNKHTDIWIKISTTFNELFNNDPRELLSINNWDVIQIQNTIQKEKKAHFPYLSGPKMSNYWLYILTSYTDAKFSNMNAISIIPDTHVQQCSAKLGITQISDSPLKVAEVWKELLSDFEISPVEMHPVLWNWSRNNFMPQV